MLKSIIIAILLIALIRKISGPQQSKDEEFKYRDNLKQYYDK